MMHAKQLVLLSVFLCGSVLFTFAQLNNVNDYCKLHFQNNWKGCMENLTNKCANVLTRRENLCKEFFQLQKDIPATADAAVVETKVRQQQQPLGDVMVATQTGANDADKQPIKAGPVMLEQLQSTMNNMVNEQVEKLRSIFALASNVIQPNQQADPAVSELSVNKVDSYYQGDVDLTINQFYDLLNVFRTIVNGRNKRKVGKPPNYELWDSFPISYEFHLSITSATKDIIRQALKLWEANTCVRFQQNGPKTDRIRFQNGDGCSSYVGKTGGTQPISIHQPGCDYVGIVSHEVGHCLGFFHEQNRPDQDKHIKINYFNINPSRYNNFVAQAAGDVQDFGIPYDFGSVMHYDGRVSSFTINPFDYAIIPKDSNYQNTMGQRNGPSFIDFKQVNSAYCSSSCPNKLGCQQGGYEDPNDCSKCKCPDGFGGKICEEAGASTAGCGGVITPTQTWSPLTSPNYPNNFPKDTKCNWVLRTTPGNKVYFKFDGTFNFECKDVCSGSYVEVKTTDFQRTGYRFCCSNKPTSEFVSAGNEMVIILRGGGKQSGGFQGMVRSDSSGAGGATPKVQTAATESPTVAGQTTPIPSTFAPGGPCSCNSWSSWTECDDTCGGCGFKTRQRTCQQTTKECQANEKIRCNMAVCGDVNGMQFRNGKIQLFMQGCCAGLFANNGQCAGLTDSLGNLGQILGGLLGNGKKK